MMLLSWLAIVGLGFAVYNMITSVQTFKRCPSRTGLVDLHCALFIMILIYVVVLCTWYFMALACSFWLDMTSCYPWQFPVFGLLAQIVVACFMVDTYLKLGNARIDFMTLDELKEEEEMEDDDDDDDDD